MKTINKEAVADLSLYDLVVAAFAITANNVRDELTVCEDDLQKIYLTKTDVAVTLIEHADVDNPEHKYGSRISDHSDGKQKNLFKKFGSEVGLSAKGRERALELVEIIFEDDGIIESEAESATEPFGDMEVVEVVDDINVLENVEVPANELVLDAVESAPDSINEVAATIASAESVSAFSQIARSFGPKVFTTRFDRFVDLASINLPGVTAKRLEMMEEIRFRFHALDRKIEGICKNDGQRGLLITGSGGIGKTFGVSKILEARVGKDNFAHIKGKCTPIMFFAKCYQFREKGQIVLVDDADALFAKEDGLNLMKAATETDGIREMSWNTATKVLDSMGIPMDFEFEGSVIAISNKDFDNLKANEEHMQAVLTRCPNLNIGLFHSEERYTRILQVQIDQYQEVLAKTGLTESQFARVMQWIEDNREDIKDAVFSLRLPLLASQTFAEYNTAGDDFAPIDLLWERAAALNYCPPKTLA